MKVWKYAVILFTSAFVVLLLTAYSQIKFNRNIDNYRSQIYNGENEKNKYRVNLKTALDENVMLKEEIAQVKNQLIDDEKKLEDSDKEKQQLQDKYTDMQNNYEALLAAESEYAKENIIKCAEMLISQVNINQLGPEGKIVYQSMADVVFEKASYQFYKEGYGQYKKKQYLEAAKSFADSLRYSKKSYFSDDCYFFLAYSEHYQGNNTISREYIDLLLKNYPDSSYKKDAEDLLKVLP
jgi:TolA-binding protein